MDAAEAHRQLSRATGAQPYAPPLATVLVLLGAVRMRAHHAALIEPERIEAARTVLPGGLNGVAAALGHATSAMEEFADTVRKLVETAEEVIDDDGREVWLTSGEVELDQWTQRLTDAAAAVRRQLGGGA